MAPELSIVMPVYNEAEALEGVVAEWVAMLDDEAIDYELRIYDDGSRDGTAEILRRLAADNPGSLRRRRRIADMDRRSCARMPRRAASGCFKPIAMASSKRRRFRGSGRSAIASIS